MSGAELAVVLASRPIGRLVRGARRRLSLHYDADWRAAARSFPLSLSMPLSAADHSHEIVSRFLWGLLPENPLVIDRWARHFQVSPADPFALLGHVGEDCPGAVQLVPPERLNALLHTRSPRVQWLSEAELGERLRLLRADAAAWRRPSDSGQFSLAGAQPKTALIRAGARFGIPSGRTPTTHILKPPLADLDGHAENEHVCLALARVLGLASAHSEVMRFDGEVAIVVERYDRVRVGTRLTRIHQEDMCQALGLPPSAKHQNEGGPGPARIVELLRTYGSRADDDVRAFLEALILNWLIAGTDAHAKNYSLLLGGGGQVRLAPLYDVASALPYGPSVRKLKLAMKLGGTYRIHDVGRRDFEKLAAAVAVDAMWLIERARALAAALPDATIQVLREARRDGLSHPLLSRMAKAFAERAKHCASVLR